jgi:hypothetical protein
MLWIYITVYVRLVRFFIYDCNSAKTVFKYITKFKNYQKPAKKACVHDKMSALGTPAGELLHSTKMMDLVSQRYNLVVIFALMATKLYL